MIFFLVGRTDALCHEQLTAILYELYYVIEEDSLFILKYFDFFIVRKLEISKNFKVCMKVMLIINGQESIFLNKTIFNKNRTLNTLTYNKYM